MTENTETNQDSFNFTLNSGSFNIKKMDTEKVS